MEFTLLWAVLTAAAGGRIAIWLTRPGTAAADLLVGSAATGLLIGRLAAMVGDGVNPVAHPTDIIIVRAGVDTGFASLGALAMLAWLTRLDLRAMDRLAPVGLAALAGWHGGCVWRGTCLGTATELPWGLAQAGSPIGRHPVELYAAVLLVVAAWLVRRTVEAPPGVAAGAALIFAAGIRLATQPFRPSLGGGPVGWYAAGVAVGLLSIAIGLRSESHPDTSPRAVDDLDTAAAGLDDSPGDR